jgi:hypothetical protein
MVFWPYGAQSTERKVLEMFEEAGAVSWETKKTPKEAGINDTLATWINPLVRRGELIEVKLYFTTVSKSPIEKNEKNTWNKLREAEATSPENSKTAEELGLSGNIEKFHSIDQIRKYYIAR